MKQIIHHLKNNINKQAINSFAVVFVGAILIWFIGPHVKIDQHAPFAHRHDKFLIPLLFLGWLIKNFISRNELRLSLSAFKTLPTVLKETLQARLSGKIQLSKLPWYLLIGPRNAGKTSLLSNSNIHFILKNNVNQKTIDTIAAAGNCDWWVTHENVILDVPGEYISTQGHAEIDTRQPWQALFEKKTGYKNSLRGVIVALPLSDLTSRETRMKFAETLKLRITELKEKFGRNLPFYFTVTKCDLLPGFMDFFNNSGSDELGQAWGITMPVSSQNESMVDIFTQRFDALIGRLNKQLIWRLHQEMGSFERVFIKDFPLQIERLKEMLIDVLKTISGLQNTFCLQGVYLTSAIQHPVEELEQPPAENISSQALRIMQTPKMPSRSYFIRQFLTQGLIANTAARTPQIWQRRSATYALCASTIAITIVFLGYDIFYGKDKDKGKTIEVASFNIVVPQAKPQETKINDSLTIVG